MSILVLAITHDTPVFEEMVYGEADARSSASRTAPSQFSDLPPGIVFALAGLGKSRAIGGRCSTNKKAASFLAAFSNAGEFSLCRGGLAGGHAGRSERRGGHGECHAGRDGCRGGHDGYRPCRGPCHDFLPALRGDPG